jgi:hypothetical protein
MLCSTWPLASNRQVRLEPDPVVAFLLRCILWRRTARGKEMQHRTAGYTVIYVAYPGLKSGACATYRSFHFL